MEREKSILKQGAVQHLYGRLAGTLRADAGDAALLVRPSPLDVHCCISLHIPRLSMRWCGPFWLS